ncbi:MAG: hypothetical protein ABH851_06610 [Methanobacteriota archaeon]
MSNVNRNILFSIVFAIITTLILLNVVYAQPLPCYVNGTVLYSTGSPCTDVGDCYCNITNSSGSFIGSTEPNASGVYVDTVNVYSYDDIITVNCTDDIFRGWNSDACTGGKVQIDVTVIVPEYPEITTSHTKIPGFIMPIFISTLLCFNSLGSKDDF